MDASTFQLSMPPLYTWNNNKLTLPIVNTKVNTNCRYHVLKTISSIGHTLTPYFIAGKTKPCCIYLIIVLVHYRSMIQLCLVMSRLNVDNRLLIMNSHNYCIMKLLLLQLNSHQLLIQIESVYISQQWMQFYKSKNVFNYIKLMKNQSNVMNNTVDLMMQLSQSSKII